MQHDHRYPAPHHDDRPEPARPIVKASGTVGTFIAWALIALLGVLAASAILAGIVALWRVIL